MRFPFIEHEPYLWYGGQLQGIPQDGQPSRTRREACSILEAKYQPNGQENESTDAKHDFQWKGFAYVHGIENFLLPKDRQRESWSVLRVGNPFHKTLSLLSKGLNFERSFTFNNTGVKHVNCLPRTYDVLLLTRYELWIWLPCMNTNLIFISYELIQPIEGGTEVGWSCPSGVNNLKQCTYICISSEKKTLYFCYVVCSTVKIQCDQLTLMLWQGTYSFYSTHWLCSPIVVLLVSS